MNRWARQLLNPFAHPFSFIRNSRGTPERRSGGQRQSCRPMVETLEDRTMPSAAGLAVVNSLHDAVTLCRRVFLTIARHLPNLCGNLELQPSITAKKKLLMFKLGPPFRNKKGPAPRRSFLRLEQLEDRCVPAVLTYSSYFGGDVSDHINSVATDAAGNIFVGGVLGDDTFPGPAGMLNATGYNGFVSELNSTGTKVIFTDFIHTDLNGVTGIAVDGSDNVYVTGSTELATGFATAGAAQTTYGGLGNAFAIKIDGVTHAIDYATYIGGLGPDTGRAIAVNAAGDAFVTGETTSTHFPVKNPLSGQGALQSHAGTDAFVTEVNPTGSAFLFSTYLGGNVPNALAGVSSDSHAFAIALDKAGNVYLTGYTEASDFPVTSGAFQTVPGDAQSVFVTELQAPSSTQGSKVLYSTFLSSPSTAPFQDTGDDAGNGITVDSLGNILVTGATSSVDFPTKDAFQSQLDRGSPALDDAFVTKLNPNKTGAAQLVYSTFDGGSAADQGNAIAVDSAGDAFVGGDSNSEFIFDNGNWPVVNPFQSWQGPGGFVAEFSPTGAIVFNSKYGSIYGSPPSVDAITVSPFGNVIFAGDTGSPKLNTTANAYQPNFPGATDNGFLAMLSRRQHSQNLHGR